MLAAGAGVVASVRCCRVATSCVVARIDTARVGADPRVFPTGVVRSRIARTGVRIPSTRSGVGDLVTAVR